MVCVLCLKEIKAGEPFEFWAWKPAHKACVEKKKQDG